jgi:hypothetical protein
MASDLVLVLHSEHRELRELADRCGRPSRGHQDPAEQLRRRLSAHLVALEAVLAPVRDARLDAVAASLRETSADLTAPGRDEVAASAERVAEAEERQLLPLLEDVLLVNRRRMGTVFRMKRDAALRGEASAAVRRQRSQTELYELARRAGLAQRSRMTLAELDEAVSEWERAQAGRTP